MSEGTLTYRRRASLDSGLSAGLFDTSPPQTPVEGSPLLRWKRRMAGKVSASLLPIVKKVARPYVGGDTVEDAMCVVERLEAEGFATTLGYWDTGRDTARQVADIYLDAVLQLSANDFDCTVSIKPPPLRFASQLADELAGVAAAHRVGLHCDSHGPNVAELSNAVAQEIAAKIGGKGLGITLPGRWSRSLRDADWAIARALNVRVVKGQWPDPEDPMRDMSAGYLEVIQRLAGRARHVGVATHDFSLACEAIERLRAAGTSCELELLLGMPCKPLIRWADKNDVKVRVYVPFGSGFVPNAICVLKRNPRLIYAIAKERMTAWYGGIA